MCVGVKVRRCLYVIFCFYDIYSHAKYAKNKKIYSIQKIFVEEMWKGFLTEFKCNTELQSPQNYFVS